MQLIRALQCGTILLTLSHVMALTAQAPSPSPDTPTIQVNSRLVFLDVTVLDKKGRPVVSGLTKDDFILTEDKKPQRIFSFEPPESHVVGVDATADNPAGKAPVTIFVLDLLDSRFSDFAYIKYMVRKYLAAQPAQLDSPAEIMVLGNQTLEMVQGYTRSKADLLYSLDHLQSVLPYKEINGAFWAERFGQTIDALQQIALQSRGVAGRKNIVWVGHGGPSIYTVDMPPSTVDLLNRYVHDTTNMLVDSRVSLFLIYPGLSSASVGYSFSEAAAGADIGEDDPFAGDINFGVFVNETGGRLFYNRNDVNAEIKQSEQLGSEYYTLTYQPAAGRADGKFRRIRMALRDPSLRVMTKAGYFSPEKDGGAGPRQQRMVNLAEAERSSLPFNTLDVKIEDLVRHPDTRTAQFTVVLSSHNLDWLPNEAGKSSVDLLMAAASLSGGREFLASKVEGFQTSADSQNPAQLAKATTRIPMTLRMPRKTNSLRVVIQLSTNGRTGAAELDRKALEAAPEAPTPEPKLMPQPIHQPAPPPVPATATRP
ncbi:MAG: VWA domain-containing protein [Acidobacteriota bacterium]|nr:VWA domain-containing protein [Acidobacteriota bacterium]